MLITVLVAGLAVCSVLLCLRRRSALLKHEKMLRSLYEKNQDGIITVDSMRRVVGLNHAASHIFNVDPSTITGQQISCLASRITYGCFNNEAEFFNTEQRISEARVVLHNGNVLDLHLRTVPLRLDRDFSGHYLIVRDITAEKKAREQVDYLAFHDELTGLDNRRKFNLQLEEMIRSHTASGSEFAVMVMDMDRFKLINDSLGHTYGDQFLTEVSSRILNVTKGLSISIARVGGDEITVLYPNCTPSLAAELADKLVAAVHQPYRLKEHDLYVTASIGISLFPEHGTDALSLIRNADEAMYEVKKNGKNGYHIFTNELHEQLKLKAMLESDLRKAIRNNDFMLYYQPQFRAEDYSMIGVEALLRWNHPTRGVLGPDEFIPMLEELGLIADLGRWVLKEACMQMKKWQDAGGPRIPVAVNMSSQQLIQCDLVRQISNILQETQLEPHYLELEITESMMVNPHLSASVVKELDKLGVRISLDDFGTGFSSLGCLKRFPIYKLKIDKSFIKDIAASASDKAVVATIISMARHLNMQVIAEGIETKEQLEVIMDTSCEEVQGFYCSRPLPPHMLESSLFAASRNSGLKRAMEMELV